MGKGELEKSKMHIIVELVNYQPNTIASKVIIKKPTGDITISSVDAGEVLPEKTSPFDLYVQVIDGIAELTLDKKVYPLQLGEGIIIPAHAKYAFNARERFKMIVTSIKSGYED